jgi:hypothetical protein
MIRAKDILALTEKWIKAYGASVEILENPSSWREASSDLKDERGWNYREGESRDLRFSLDPESRELLVWIAQRAIHIQVVPPPRFSNTWRGYINITKKTVKMNPPQGWIDHRAPWPEELISFTRGLRFKGRMDG